MQMCKGICLEYSKAKKPFGIKFLDNRKCRMCDTWYPITSEAGQRRTCFCCGSLLAIKPRISSSRRNQEAYQVIRI